MTASVDAAEDVSPVCVATENLHFKGSQPPSCCKQLCGRLPGY